MVISPEVEYLLKVQSNGLRDIDVLEEKLGTTLNLINKN